MGGVLEADDRAKVDATLRTQTDALPACAPGDTVYEYRVNERTGEWEHWGAKVPQWQYAHFVFDVDLRTEDPPARWILRGVCLLTTKD